MKRQPGAMGQERFSKATVTADIQKRINGIQNDWHFDPNDGYAQVMRKYPSLNAQHQEHFAAANRAYGEYYALRMLAENWDLAIDPKGKFISPVPRS